MTERYIRNIRQSLKGLIVEESENPQIVLTENDAIFKQLKEQLNDHINVMVNIDSFIVNTTQGVTANLKGSLGNNISFYFDFVGSDNDGVTIETNSGGVKLSGDYVAAFQKLTAVFDGYFKDEIKKTYLTN
jgi:hypothetical protein